MTQQSSLAGTLIRLVRPGWIEVGGARMALLDIKGGFEGIKSLLRRAFGERAAGLVHDLGLRGGEDFMDHALSRGLVEAGEGALGGALAAYTEAGFGRFALREQRPAEGWAVIEAEDAFEGWAGRELRGTGSEGLCDYSRGVLLAFARESVRDASPAWFDALVCLETRCIARGDAACTFVVGPRDRLEALGHRVPAPERGDRSVEAIVAEIRDRETLYRQLAEDVLDGIYVLDAAGTVLYCNRASETLLEMPRERIVGSNYAQFIHAADLPRVAGLFTDLQSGRLTEVERFETRMVTGTGAVRDFEMNARGTYDADGRLVRIEGVGRDLTPRKQLEAQLVSAERFAAVGKIAAELAHEVNNPLAVVKTSLAVIAGEPVLGDASRECLEGAAEEIDRVAGILRDFLGFYQAAGERGAAACDANGAVRSFVTLVRHPMEARGVALALDLDPTEPRPRCPTDPFKQVLMNLLVNARDAVGPGGCVLVRTRTEGDTFSLTVEDDGPGVPEGERDRIFEPYVTTKPPGQGTGLGLTVVRGIVTRYGGTIEVADASDRGGSRFTVRLPLADPSA